MSARAMCEVVDDEIVIRVSLDALASATELTMAELLGLDPEAVAFKVTCKMTWAESLVEILTTESETGETRLTRLLDGGIREAYEQGCEGVDQQA